MRFFDNTIVSGFKNCPRLYYLRHVLFLTKVGTSAPLAFGGAWHGAMDVIYAKYHTSMGVDDLVNSAMEGFLTKWVEEGLPADLTVDQVAALSPRTPGTAKEMLYQYISKRANILDEFEIVAIEQPFAFPIYPDSTDLWYCGRLDKVGHLGKQTLIIEHKTSSEYKIDGGFKNSFIDQFGINSQTDGYLFGGNLAFDKIDQLWVDGALVHNKVHDVFKFIPISRSLAALTSWFDELKMWIGDILKGEELLAKGEPLSKAFPRNTESCIGRYGTCQFYDICRQHPDGVVHGVPDGYKKEQWKPFDTLKLSKLFDDKEKA